MFENIHTSNVKFLTILSPNTYASNNFNLQLLTDENSQFCKILLGRIARVQVQRGRF